MKRRVWMVAFVLLISFLTLSAGCAMKGSEPVALTISAAASLTDAMEEIKAIYAKENEKIALTYNFGSSGALQQQIEQGAPADMFISAAPKQMDALQDQELIINDTRKDLLENKIVLIIPKEAQPLSSFEDLATDKVKKFAIGAPDSVPAGKYAKETLISLKIWDKVEPKLVLAKDVRQVLAYVETGNVEAGIVYQTDAQISEKIQIAAVAPDESHSPIIYPAAVLKSSKHANEAREFLEFLSGDQAQEIFEKYGFTVIAK